MALLCASPVVVTRSLLSLLFLPSTYPIFTSSWKLYWRKGSRLFAKRLARYSSEPDQTVCPCHGLAFSRWRPLFPGAAASLSHGRVPSTHTAGQVPVLLSAVLCNIQPEIHCALCLWQLRKVSVCVCVVLIGTSHPAQTETSPPPLRPFFHSPFQLF